MITFTAQRDDTTLIGFGLSKENVVRLQKGRPILVRDIDGFEFMIFYGETEEVMKEDLQRFIGPETKVRDQQ